MNTMHSRTAVALIGLLLSAAACNRVRPECWGSQQDRPINCDPGWCWGPCTDAQAFQWLAQYDVCIQQWTDEEIRATPLLAKEGTAKNHCYAWFIQSHQGITKEQMEKYRLLNPQAAPRP